MKYNLTKIVKAWRDYPIKLIESDEILAQGIGIFGAWEGAIVGGIAYAITKEPEYIVVGSLLGVVGRTIQPYLQSMFKRKNEK